MHKGLKKDIAQMLACYYSDVYFWGETMEANNINMITAGTPHFKCYEDARAWRIKIFAILKEFTDELVEEKEKQEAM